MPSTIDTSAEPARPLCIAELLDARAFPHPVDDLQVRETHISWVVLTGALAYKIKKPVKFDFIDTSTLPLRRHHCDEELRLNRRLAPDLYLNVVPICRRGGQAYVGDDSAPAIEYAVQMRQFDADQELTALLQRDAVTAREIGDLGERLAHFHRHAQVPPSSGQFENTEHMHDAVYANLQALRPYAARFGILSELQQLTDWTHDAARALESVFEAREQSGQVREGHGDLHSGNIVRWAGRLTPFDCIDFDPHLRRVDVISDVAFLVMDLTSRNHLGLAAVLLDRYLEATGDYDGMALLRFYAVYRALIRAKVDALMAAQSPGRTAEFQDRLLKRVAAALHWIQPPRVALILMHGASGSGKSWLSEQLVAALPGLRIRSDLERKRLAGLGGTTTVNAPGQGLYAPHMNHRTYARLLECAQCCLQAGFNTLVDAAFLDAADRELFAGLATRLRVPMIIVSCHADPATLLARIESRAAAGHDPSDADEKVLAAQLRTLAPLRPEESTQTITVDTREPEALQRVVAAIRCATLSTAAGSR